MYHAERSFYIFKGQMPPLFRTLSFIFSEPLDCTLGVQLMV